MIITGIKDEDFVNYKKPCMFISFPYCSFKCERESNGAVECQNKHLINAAQIAIRYSDIVWRYIQNDIPQAIVFGGLEPFDSWEDMVGLIEEFRKFIDDPIIIYTGYEEYEIQAEIDVLRDYDNIIIKFGRYKNSKGVVDEILGVKLISDNQYAKQISGENISRKE